MTSRMKSMRTESNMKRKDSELLNSIELSFKIEHDAAIYKKTVEVILKDNKFKSFKVF